MDPHVTLADVRAAAQRIAGHVERTPSALSRTLSEILGVDVVLKQENLQFTAAFKERGAANRLALLDADERERGVLAVSAGNHAQAVAHHAARLGIDATIVMPATTPFVKVHRTQLLGARVVLAGDDLAAAFAAAERIVATENRILIHPYDDPAVIAGQGTVALELLEDHPDLGALVVPVGGGGLLAGIAVTAHALRPEVLLVGVQSDRFPSMLAAVAGEAPSVGGTTVADGIAVPQAGSITGPIIRTRVDLLRTVTDDEVETAMNLLLEVEKVVVEGAGAVGIAALLEPDDELRRQLQGRRVGVVLSGGNVDPRLLASVIMRGLLRTGRLARLVVDMADAPGSLGALTSALGRAGANIVELVHDRMLLDLSARAVEVEVVVETFDRPHLERVVGELVAAGFRTTVAETR